MYGYFAATAHADYGDPMLRFTNLSVGYNGNPALSDVSFQLNPAEILALIGPNGSGKTTLINSACGVTAPTSGQVEIDGQNVMGMNAQARARLIAVVPQARVLPAAFSVWQVVMLGRTPYLGWLGIPTTEDKELVERAISDVDLSAIAQRRIGELSGGEKQRVLLARALAQDTPYLLLDEPTAHLDIRYQHDFLELIRRLSTEKSLTILISLHDLNQAFSIADRVALLSNGQLVAIGQPEEVMNAKMLVPVYGVAVEIIHHPITGTAFIHIPTNAERTPIQALR